MIENCVSIVYILWPKYMLLFNVCWIDYEPSCPFPLQQGCLTFFKIFFLLAYMIIPKTKAQNATALVTHNPILYGRISSIENKVKIIIKQAVPGFLSAEVRKLIMVIGLCVFQFNW